MADLIDSGDKWAGGDTVVVQVNAGWLWVRQRKQCAAVDG